VAGYPPEFENPELDNQALAKWNQERFFLQALWLCSFARPV
jgi:hypothetical protein